MDALIIRLGMDNNHWTSLLRDADSGLLDFPAVTTRGVVYLLCWKRDEEDLAWWHFAEEGFAGRKPLPLSPDL